MKHNEPSQPDQFLNLHYSLDFDVDLFLNLTFNYRNNTIAGFECVIHVHIYSISTNKAKINR